MKQKFLVAFLLIAVAVVAGCTSSSNTIASGTNQSSQEQQQAPVEAPAAAMVQMSQAGFGPNEVTLKQGGVVTWVNIGGVEVWPASAFHPTHEAYPGSSITKCGTPEQSGIFDACRGLQPGESWSFMFNEKGTWVYHDHLNPSRFGRIIVV